jgi:Flp pilus assembly protein TadG
MKTNRTQKGQAIILIVFGVVALIALAGLAVDGTVTYSNRQGAQTAAENAALTGALDLANSKGNTTAVTDAKLAATTNGFNNNITTNTVTVKSGGGFVAGCNGTTPSFSDNTQYVQVIIQTNVNTTFSSIIGVKQTHNCVDAIARGQNGVTGSMFNGAAIVATKNDGGCNQTIVVNGGGNITTTNGGIFDNCGGSQALYMQPGSTITSPSNVQVVGGDTNLGTVTPGITTGAVGVSMPVAAWNTIPAIPSAPTCSGNGSVTPISYLSGNSVNTSGNATLSPGTFSNITVGSGTLTFSPGTYCITGYINVNSGSMAGTTGTVNIVFSNGFNENGGITMNFSDLEIWSPAGNWQINGSLNATKLRFYSTGSSQFVVGSAGSMTSGNSFFYVTSGYMYWNSGATVNLAAPGTGDPYAALEMYMPWGNISSLIINSGSTVNVTGTILAPSAAITLNGSGTVNALHSQIIGSTFTDNGNINVNFNASQNYATPSSALVELIK